MIKLVGKIKEIVPEETYKSYSKKLMKKKNVILKMENNQLVKIQFQGHDMNLLEGFKENQEVLIECVFRGQYTTNRFYDNIVGKRIIKH